MSATATTKEPKMANDKSASINDIDFSKIDLAALKTLVDRASATFQERKVGELKTLVNGWILKAESVGYSISDVLDEVRSRLPQPAAPAAKRAKVDGEKLTRPSKYKPLDGMTKLDEDKTKARPELNTTYKLPNGETWTTKKQLGRTPGNVIEALHAGATWAEMKSK